MIIAFAIATIGYGGVAMQENILAPAAIPYILLMGVGMSSTILAATVLLGQEALPRLRGSAFGMQSFFGACGILAMSAVGGRLYDNVNANAVFYMIAGANLVVLVAALLVRGSELGKAQAQC
jgi:MFS family permease